MPISSSTLHGLFTWPEMQKILVPVFFGRPSALNQAAPRRRIVGRDGDGFDIVDCGRAAIKADRRREWRLQARLALLAFQAFQQRGLFAADIGAGAAMEINVVVVARAAGIVADQPGLIGLVDGDLQIRRPRYRTRRGYRCMSPCSPWRSRRPGNPRPAYADRSAGFRGPCRCRARTRPH